MRSLRDPRLHATLARAGPSADVPAALAPAAPVIPAFASPADWRDVWIYFLMIDRFNRDDGVPPRFAYDQPCGSYQGGSFNGVTARLDYLQALGVGAIWLTPVLKNRPSDDGSYHGYGIHDFLRPDPRFASSPERAEHELRALVDAAHARGLYVIFDIVLNHAGDVFGYRGHGASAPRSAGVLPIEWRDEHGAARADWPSIDAMAPAARPADGLVWPAELQHDAWFRRQGRGGEAGGDFESLKEFDTGLRDGTGHPVRDALILAYQYAIARYDVDGFRIDTLKYVEPDFAQTFGNAMREYALSIGKKNFFSFGEVYDGEERIAEFIGRHTSQDSQLVGVDAALDFPLFFVLPQVVKGFAPPSALVEVFRHRQAVQRELLSSHGEAGRFFVSFLDNHDQRERIRPAADERPDRHDAQVVLGVALLFTLQGIACLYYGTEQGLHGRGDSDRAVREALWGRPGGFDRQHPLYRAIAALAAVRAAQPALRYGRLYFRPLSGDGRRFGISGFAPGVLAYSRILNAAEVVVVANCSGTDAFAGYVLIDARLHPDGRMLRVLNDAGAAPSGPIETRSDLDITEVDGGRSHGPARMVPVRLRPMEVQILGV